MITRTDCVYCGLAINELTGQIPVDVDGAPAIMHPGCFTYTTANGDICPSCGDTFGSRYHEVAHSADVDTADSDELAAAAAIYDALEARARAGHDTYIPIHSACTPATHVWHAVNRDFDVCRECYMSRVRPLTA